MVNTAANQEREMRVAVERVVGFAQEFGEAHLNLVCHAAFPLSLTPDLLYQIWANFVPEAPWTAVARVLLSRLCKQVGSEMYEMDNSVRNLLLRELKVQFGQERFDSLGEFLLEYVSQRLTEDDPDTQDLRQAQEWTALAYTKPETAAIELAQVLNDRFQHKDIGEVLRLSSLAETLSEPLLEAGFEPLLICWQGMRSSVFGNLADAKKQLAELKTISVKNTSQPAIPDKDGRARWDCTIYLDADQKTLSQIKCVKYKLHETFSKPLIKINNNQNNPHFAYKLNVWGVFDIKVKIFLKNGSIRNLSHWLKVRRYEEKIESTNIDYLRLKNLLAEGKWKEADWETANIFLKASNCQKQGWLGVENIRNISCETLTIIDQLWIHYSDVRFGLTIQKRIWENLIDEQGNEEYELWWNFGEIVGWRKNNKWLQYKKLIFQLDAPQGHLPCFRSIIGMKKTGISHNYHQINRFSSLMSRLKECDFA